MSDTAEAPEILGIAHPNMTVERMRELIPEVRLPFDMARQLAFLCNPMEYRSVSVGQLMRLADAFNESLDEQLRAAQMPTSQSEPQRCPGASDPHGVFAGE
jgi:hypothetical protein